MLLMVMCTNGKNGNEIKDLDVPILKATKMATDYELYRVKRVPVNKPKWTNVVQDRNEGIDGTLEVIGTPECETKVCEAAMCAVVDDWFLFGQTCNMLRDSTGTSICNQIDESTVGNDNIYSFLFDQNIKLKNGDE